MCEGCRVIVESECFFSGFKHPFMGRLKLQPRSILDGECVANDSAVGARLIIDSPRPFLRGFHLPSAFATAWRAAGSSRISPRVSDSLRSEPLGSSHSHTSAFNAS